MPRVGSRIKKGRVEKLIVLMLVVLMVLIVVLIILIVVIVLIVVLMVVMIMSTIMVTIMVLVEMMMVVVMAIKMELEIQAEAIHRVEQGQTGWLRVRLVMGFELTHSNQHRSKRQLAVDKHKAQLWAAM